MNTSRLLIIGCSQKKVQTTGLMPAIDRYDGPAFRVLRRYLQTRRDDAPDILILSAKFGLIMPNEPIPFYDQRMTNVYAEFLRERNQSLLLRMWRARKYSQVYISAGKEYLIALGDAIRQKSRKMTISFAEGLPGKRLSDLHRWLYGEEKAERQTRMQKQQLQFHGVPLLYRTEEIKSIARRAIQEGKLQPNRYQTWYVPIDDYRIAPKSLVSVLTGLPVGAFHSDEARSVLSDLGVGVSK